MASPVWVSVTVPETVKIVDVAGGVGVGGVGAGVVGAGGGLGDVGVLLSSPHALNRRAEAQTTSAARAQPQRRIDLPDWITA